MKRCSNTDLKRELDQMARMLHMVVEYKHKIGFRADLVEPKPQEPSKHQYDYDVATVYGFLKTYGLKNEVKVNIEQAMPFWPVTASSTSWRSPTRSASSVLST